MVPAQGHLPMKRLGAAARRVAVRGQTGRVQRPEAAVGRSAEEAGPEPGWWDGRLTGANRSTSRFIALKRYCTCTTTGCPCLSGVAKTPRPCTWKNALRPGAAQGSTRGRGNPALPMQVIAGTRVVAKQRPRLGVSHP